jgi:hypothetical protein
LGLLSGRGNGRSPSGMTTRKATATAEAWATMG